MEGILSRGDAKESREIVDGRCVLILTVNLYRTFPVEREELFKRQILALYPEYAMVRFTRDGSS